MSETAQNEILTQKQPATLREALLKTIEKIKADARAAEVSFGAQTYLEAGTRCIAKVRQFEIPIDEPAELGGTNTAMNPVELVLSAFGACQEIMYAAYAAVLGIPITSLEIDVRGDLNLKGLFGMDDAVPPGYRKVSWETRIESPASAEQIRELVAVVQKTCPVLDILRRPIDTESEVMLNGESLPLEEPKSGMKN